MASPFSTPPDAGAPPPEPRPVSRRELFRLGRRDGETGHWIRVHRVAMACRFEILLDPEDAAAVAPARESLDEADRIEAALTVFRDTSELVRVNRTAAEQPA